jgi:hypothetical protein
MQESINSSLSNGARALCGAFKSQGVRDELLMGKSGLEAKAMF